MIPYSQWRDRVCALLQNPLQSVMDLLDDSWAHQHLPRFENPPAYLPGTSWPRVDAVLLGRYYADMVRQGLLPLPDPSVSGR